MTFLGEIPNVVAPFLLTMKKRRHYQKLSLHIFALDQNEPVLERLLDRGLKIETVTFFAKKKFPCE